jgi:ankyrin repeat protein
MSKPSQQLTSALIILFAVLQCARAGAESLVADAAERGDASLVRELLRGGADVNESQGDGMTALHWATDHGDQELAEVLVYAGANVNAGTRIGDYTPLHIASRHGHADIVRTLLAAHADPDATTTNSGVTSLHLASASRSPEAVKALLDAGADVNATERAWSQTPLIFAAAEDRVENVRLLLAAGANLAVTTRVVDVVERELADQAANKRITALIADFKGKAGGDANWLPQPNEVQGAIDLSREVQRNWPNVPDPACDDQVASAGSRFSRAEGPNKCKHTPDESDEVEPLDESPPDPQSYGQLVGNWGGLTALLHAVRQGHAETALALLESGADIDQVSAGDHTSPLLMAMVNGQFDLGLVLLERGADPNLVSDAGTGPLFAVLERQWAPWAHYAHPVDHQLQDATYLEALEALLNAGADPNIRLEKNLWYAEFTSSVLTPAGLHYDGATPFWRAAQALDVKAMQLLKAHGADPGLATRKIAKRERTRRDPEGNEIEEADHSGLMPVAIGDPFIYPLHAAAGAGYGQYFMAHAHRHVPDNWLPAVKFLVEECGADVNARDGNGYSPLHHAASRGDNELIEYLVQKGADVTLVSRKGETTADMANGPTQRVSPFPDTIALLVGLGAVNNNHCVSC